MNRREFTASLAAAAAAPVLPLKLATPAAAAPAALPGGTYMWAEFIAKARGHVDAGFLARRLQLSSAQAAQVMSELVANGAVRSAGLTGVAQATKPFRFPTQTTRSTSAKIIEHVKDTLRDEVKRAQDPEPEFEDTDQLTDPHTE